MRSFLNQLMRVIGLTSLGVLFISEGITLENEKIEILSLDIVSYEAFVREDPYAIRTLKKALLEKGIVGIRGIPGYKEKLLKFIEIAREFSVLPEEIKETYAPNRSVGEMFLGYEKEKNDLNAQMAGGS